MFILFIHMILIIKSFHSFIHVLYNHHHDDDGDTVIVTENFKPITFFIFRIYLIMFHVDKFYVYIMFLLFGQQLFEILSHPLYRKLDQSFKTGRLIAISMIIYNLAINFILFIFIIPSSMKTMKHWNILFDLSMDFVEQNNHDQIIIIITIYIVVMTKNYFNQIIDWIQTSKLWFFLSFQH